VGYARKTNKPVLLLTGETAFLYDRNALWTGEPLPKNLKIVVLNNGGGIIFRLIDGPANLPERDRFFENRHTHTARSAAEDFGLAYHACTEVSEAVLQEHLWQVDGPALVEVFCPPA
jgi:2-succinyl-5-enolpyruvyl-6-hydroxy-3-cyclohexene-1-carboxylate synthase